MSLIKTFSCYRSVRKAHRQDMPHFYRVSDESSAKDMARSYLTQSLQLLEPLGDIAKDRSHSQYAPVSVRKWQHREFDLGTRSIFT